MGLPVHDVQGAELVLDDPVHLGLLVPATELWSSFPHKLPGGPILITISNIISCLSIKHSKYYYCLVYEWVGGFPREGSSSAACSTKVFVLLGRASSQQGPVAPLGTSLAAVRLAAGPTLSFAIPPQVGGSLHPCLLEGLKQHAYETQGLKGSEG